MEENIREELIKTSLYKQKRYSGFSDFYEGIAYYHDWLNDSWIYIDTTGKEILSVHYKTVKAFHEGLAAVENEDGLWGYIDKNGNEVIPCEFSVAKDFVNGLGVVAHSKKEGAINKKGEKVIPYKFVIVDPLNNGLVATYKNSSCAGLYTHDGKELVPCKYYSIHDFSEGLACVVDEHYHVGYINEAGEEVIRCAYRHNYRGETFKNGYAAICLDRPPYDDHFINKKGELLSSIPFYDDGKYKWKIVDPRSPKFHFCNTGKTYDADEFSEGYAPVKTSEDKYNFINIRGEFAFEKDIKCYYLGSLHDGWAVYIIPHGDEYSDDPCSFININGERISDKWYKEVSDFHNGVAFVQDFNDLYGAIDTSGKEIIPCMFTRIGRPEGYANYGDDFEMSDDGVIYACNDTFNGYFDKTGRVIKNLSQEIYSAEITNVKEDTAILMCAPTQDMLKLKLAQLIVDGIRIEKDKEETSGISK